MRLKLIGLVLGIFLVVGSSAYAQYTHLDRHGNYKGYIDKGDTRVDFYGKDNMMRGWIDRGSGATYDRHNNFRGWVIESDRDSD